MTDFPDVDELPVPHDTIRTRTQDEDAPVDGMTEDDPTQRIHLPVTRSLSN